MLNHLRLPLLLSILFLGQSLTAQNNYRIDLKSGSFTPAPNIEAVDEWSPKQSEVVDGYYYRVIQFQDIPTAEERQNIEASGIRLLDYLPNNTYLAALPVGFGQAEVAHFPIRAIVDMPSAFKTDPRLVERPLPEHALRGGGYIELQLTLYKNLDLSTALGLLEKKQVQTSSVHSFSNIVAVIVPIGSISDMAELPFVQYVEPVDPPGEPENYTGTSLHRSTAINTNIPGGRKYDGTGVNVQLQDDGLIGPHIDYQGRIGEQFTEQGGATNDHGDHVAGTIIGAGNLDPRTQGMAPGANIYVYDYEPFNDSIVPHYQKHDLRITSTSYSNGCNAGYTANSRDHDMEIRLHPELIHVFSAGNNGTSDCGYGAGAGWGNVTGGHKVGKNVIAVANVDQYDLLSNGSSRGPAHDGRIKPDISAKGTAVRSTVPGNNYDFKTGTSMACPGVSGSLAQLYDAYRQLNGNVNPPSNLMKATILNTADDVGNAGPDFKFGWGRINNLRAARVIENGWYLFDSISQGMVNTHTLAIPDSVAQVNVMVYWHDHEATAGADRALVNNLDFTVTDQSSDTLLPWVLDHTPNPVNLDAPAQPGIDSLNNMEQVTILTPDTGTITLEIQGTAVPFGPQEYVIVYEFVKEELTITYPVGGESMEPGENEIIRWDGYGISGNQSLEVSFDGGSTWDTVINNLPPSFRSFSWLVPDSATGIARLRISENGTALSSPSYNFSIMRSPTNLRTDSICCGSFSLVWDSTSQANRYRVYVLGSTYMDSIGETPNTYFDIPVTNPDKVMWVSVAALGPDGALSKRAIAIPKVPGVVNCVKPRNAVLDAIITPVTSAISNCTSLEDMPLTIRVIGGGTDTLKTIPVHYQVDNGPIQADTFQGTLAFGDTTQFTTMDGITLNGPGLHELRVWVDLQNDQNRCDDTLSVTIDLINRAVVELPYNEDFEGTPTCETNPNCGEDICVLTNPWYNEINYETDDIDWRVDDGGTFSNTTGPTIDHNPGSSSGNYVYTESSNGCEGMTAAMVSPCFDLSNTTKPTLLFWYHMYGIEMGSLHLDIYANQNWHTDVWTLSGNQSNFWQSAAIDLSSYAGDTITVRFRGITGTGYRSDMALDDITLYDDVPITATVDAPDTVCVNEAVTFSQQVSPGALEYEWSFGANATPSTASIPGPITVVFTAPGTRQVTFEGSVVNRSVLVQKSIYVAPLPISQFNLNDTGLEITTTNNSTDGDTYQWDFGDGNTSVDPSPVHTYSNSGQYTIELVSFNQCGSDTTTQTITVWGVGIGPSPEEIGFQVSPNPSNGIFQISIDRPAPEMVLTLFDATGRKVREEMVNTSGNGWNTTWDNRHLAKGAYLMQLTAGDKVYRHQLVIQ